MVGFLSQISRSFGMQCKLCAIVKWCTVYIVQPLHKCVIYARKWRSRRKLSRKLHQIIWDFYISSSSCFVHFFGSENKMQFLRWMHFYIDVEQISLIFGWRKTIPHDKWIRKQFCITITTGDWAHIWRNSMRNVYNNFCYDWPIDFSMKQQTNNPHYISYIPKCLTF